MRALFSLMPRAKACDLHEIKLDPLVVGHAFLVHKGQFQHLYFAVGSIHTTYSLPTYLCIVSSHCFACAHHAMFNYVLKLYVASSQTHHRGFLSMACIKPTPQISPINVSYCLDLTFLLHSHPATAPGQGL
jgi:hypothetical protein